MQDDGGTANSGVDTSTSDNVITIDVRPVNDAPTAADATITIDEGASHVLDVTDFGFSDPVEGHGFRAVVIESLTGGGTWSDGVRTLSAGDTVTASLIASGDLVFTPAPQAEGSGYATLDFRVQDDGGTPNGGADLAVSAQRSASALIAC